MHGSTLFLLELFLIFRAQKKCSHLLNVAAEFAIHPKDMKPLAQNPYQNIIDFIDAAIDSDELMHWLTYMERLPDNLRHDHLAQIKTQMLENCEPARVIDIVQSINKQEILFAINAVIKDVYESRMRTKKYLKNHDNANFNILISLMTGA